MLAPTLLLVAVALGALPFVIASIIAEVRGDQTALYDLRDGRPIGPGETVNPGGAEFLNVAVVGLDEASGSLTLASSGNRSCNPCASPKQMTFFALDADVTQRRGITPFATVTIPAGETTYSQRVTLPVRGSPIRYPFDAYQLRLGLDLPPPEALPTGGSAGRQVLGTLQSQLTRFVMDVPALVASAPPTSTQTRRYLFVPVAPNDADADTLAQLPGVDGDRAQQLIAGRTYADEAAFLAALGRQVSPDQTNAAKAMLAATAPASVPWTKFNLNTAADAQFRTIPGVGDQMLREFAKYRPYTSLAQFQKEIGKYVDAAQVAAYQAYLFVPVDPNAADADTLAQLPGVDADRAQQLIAGRPFADAKALVAALEQLVGAELAKAAPAFLVAA